MNGSYVSIFKIDGKPIIGPLMNKKIREEMTNYKRLAIATEHRLTLNKQQNQEALLEISTTEYIIPDSSGDLFNNSSSTISESPESNESNHNKKKQNFREVIILDCKENSSSHGLKKRLNCSKTNTTVYDIESNIITKGFHFLSEENIPDSIIYKENNDRLELTSDITPTESYASNIFFPISLTSPLIETPRAKSSAGFCAPPIVPSLIRSNSYTLLHPSPMLVKHMELKGFDIKTSKKTSATKNKINAEKDVKNSHKIKTQTKGSTPSLIGISRKKNIYDIRQKSKPKINTKPNKCSSIKSSEKQESLDANQKSNFQFIVKKIESEQRKQIQELISKQQEEQKKMQENFNKQQETLLRQIRESLSLRNSSPNKLTVDQNDKNNRCSQFSESLTTVRTSTPTSFISNKSDNDDEQFSSLNGSFFYPSNLQKNYTKSITDIKKSNIDLALAIEPVSNVYLKHHLGILKHQKSEEESCIIKKKSSPLLSKKSDAATLINSHIRGYLVRRLFKTHHVQKIVNFFKDTLMFVLDLHEESENNNNPIEIQLKGQLLSKLSAACSSLHNIFFELSIKERMGIISMDRELLKTRFQKQSSNNISMFSKPNINKLELCSL